VAKKDLYNKLYSEYKQIKVSRDNVRWTKYYVNVAKGIGNTINEFASINNNKKNSKPFRLSKNGNRINLFGEYNNENNKEKIIPKIKCNIALNHIINEENNQAQQNFNLMEENKSNINIINSMMENQPNKSLENYQ